MATPIFDALAAAGNFFDWVGGVFWQLNNDIFVASREAFTTLFG